jgi:iron complex outermembrane receptor protein
MPRFSLAVDFYQTRLTQAITGLNYANGAVQAVCLSSAPSYNSPVCDLAIRPITNPSDPNYLNPAVNLPTEIRNSPVNAALQRTRGFDLQIDYSWDMAGGQFSVRHLASYQPTNSTLTTPLSTFSTWAVQPKLMQTTFLSYRNGSWNVALQNRWLSNVSLMTSDNALNGSANSPLGTQYYADSTLDANDIIDTTISKEFEVGSGKVDAFLTVNNLLNERAPLFPSGSGLPGLFYPTLGIHDDMGRFYTAGFRLKF